VSALRANLRVIGALGLRSVKQTFRRPQPDGADHRLSPPCFWRFQTGGAGAAVNLRVGGISFPQVDSFLQFMLAGAMMQSLMLAGNSGGIALAVDIEMGFTDRLFAAPISRFSIVLGRLLGTAALGALSAVWFLAIGLIFGVTVNEGIIGVPNDDRPGHPDGGGNRRNRRGDRAANRQFQRRPGPLPAGLRGAVLSSAFFPPELMLEPAQTIANYNPLSFIVEGSVTRSCSASPVRTCSPPCWR